MEAEFYMAILTCLIFGNSESFQIVHVQKQACLVKTEIVSMGSCNGTNRNQQWMWTENEKLLHVQSALCLGISNSSGRHSRSVILVHCSEAPQWTCYVEKGYLEVGNTSFFLKKQGFKVVVKKGRNYLHSWMKKDVNEEGKSVNENICYTKADLGAEVSVRSFRNRTSSRMPTTVHAAPYTLEHITKNTTEPFPRSTSESYSPSSIMELHPSLQMTDGTGTSWVPWTTPPHSRTTEEWH